MHSTRKYFLARVITICAIPVSLLLGIIAGGWIPLAIAAHVTEHSISEVNIEWGVFPKSPKWLDPVKNRSQINLLGFSSLVVGLVVGGLFGTIVQRMNHHIMVNKLKWITEADAKRSNETQWL